MPVHTLQQCSFTSSGIEGSTRDGKRRISGLHPVSGRRPRVVGQHVSQDSLQMFYCPSGWEVKFLPRYTSKRMVECLLNVGWRGRRHKILGFRGAPQAGCTGDGLTSREDSMSPVFCSF